MKESLRTLLLAPLLIGHASLAAQQPTKRTAPDPIELVSRAEALAVTDPEGAVRILWAAWRELIKREKSAVRQGTLMAVHSLLKQHDSLHVERTNTFTSIADLQVAVGKSYRMKKWYDTAEGRLNVAAMYDPEAESLAKEARKLLAKRPKTIEKQDPTPVAEEPSSAQLLQRDYAINISGDWKVVDDELLIGPHDESMPLWTWLTALEHEDHELHIELQPDEPKKTWSVGFEVGRNEHNFDGIRVIVTHYKGRQDVIITIFGIAGQQIKDLGNTWAKVNPSKPQYHTLKLQVTGSVVRAQFNDAPPVEADTKQPVHGLVGLTCGISGESLAPVRVRNLQILPLPSDAPTDEELRTQARERAQSRIDETVEEANQLLAQKTPEPAARKLRDALLLVDKLPKGVLRQSLKTSIEATLKKADPVWKRRVNAAKRCGEQLGELCDRYLADKRPRLARIVALHAIGFDPEGQRARLEAADKAIDAWNDAQRVLQQAKLAPPKDDGEMLRLWFANAERLDSRSPPWTVAGPAARAPDVASGNITTLMTKTARLLEGTMDVHVRLPADDSYAGLVFEATNLNDFSIAVLTRLPASMDLSVVRWVGGKWHNLGSKRVAIEQWRKDAWHPMRLTKSATGIKLESMDVSLTVPRAKLGLHNGRIGLTAGNSAGASATIELRAFRAKAK